jgi:two-component sensor histidine kinase
MERGEPHRSAEAAAHTALPSWFRVAEYLHGLPFWARYGLATALVLVTFALRYTLVRDAPGYHFIFFVPAVLLSSLLLARGSGFWAVFLSAALIDAFFLKPVFTLGIAHREDLLALVLFLATGIVTALISEALHEAFFRLAETNGRLVAANERIAASEHEKGVLLDELVHRFRNDLANLTAILRLQARNAPDSSARAELLSASDRVRVMGRVHQRLMRRGETATVEVGAFIEDLCKDLHVAMVGGRAIVLRTQIAGGPLPLAQAITVGLITNELVTNALKYAFPEDRPGTILVQLTRQQAEFRLIVADDGVGELGAASQGTGLGRRLIHSMAQQLGGRFESEHTKDGTTCWLHFPAPPQSRVALPSR